MGLRQVAEVIPYDKDVAEHHARLLAWTRHQGVPRGALDLVIAATAAATGRTLLTLDARARFDQLPGVQARLLTY
jgi:tRNA(fMet)-specific endonuclease VapC